MPGMEVFETLESEVRGYSRSWPTVFTKSKDARMFDEQGAEYIDFFAGAGVLNYGHNHSALQQKLIEYIQSDGVLHSLDMATTTKRDFLVAFNEIVLKPRGMDYKIQFPGPTGTNAVEAALKLARKVTERNLVVGFTNAFHGMTLGALAVTGNEMKRRGAGVPLHDSVSMPYEGFFKDDLNTIEYLERYFETSGSGVEIPAAVIVETIQAEGGLHTATAEWMQQLQRVCHEHGTLLIIDDIQAGCGRTGPFFSFEEFGIDPDIICLSKSLSGIGQPLAITLMKPELDQWDPGEHNGTFRGNNAAFVTATETLKLYWQDDRLQKETLRKADIVRAVLEDIVATVPGLKEPELRGRGLIQGIATAIPDFANAVSAEAFKRGLIIETSGPESEVIKVLPPLIIDDESLKAGLEILKESVKAALPGALEAADREPVAV
jgi:diaminobutyrate-2-oxoglutarate transaminase